MLCRAIVATSSRVTVYASAMAKLQTVNTDEWPLDVLKYLILSASQQLIAAELTCEHFCTSPE